MNAWERKAYADAWDCAENFADEMVSQWLEDGAVSDDLNNDYDGGDAYHHENHVDREYSLREAGELLEDLAEWEETDNGLWDGLEPRRAIDAQAAYTYGNCVYGLWQQIVGELNEHLQSLQDGTNGDAEAGQEVDEKTTKQFGEKAIRVFLAIGQQDYTDSKAEQITLERAAIDSLVCMDATAAAALADWYDEHELPYKASEVRKAIGLG